MARNLALAAMALACSPQADGFSFGRSASLARRSASPALKSVPMVEYEKVTALEPALDAWGVGPAPLDDFGAAVQHVSPPLLRIPSFLSPAECEMIKKAALESGDEATDYLNARVNSDGSDAAGSGYSAEQAAEAVAWSGGATSGLRLRLPDTLLAGEWAAAPTAPLTAATSTAAAALPLLLGPWLPPPTPLPPSTPPTGWPSGWPSGWLWLLAVGLK